MTDFSRTQFGRRRLLCSAAVAGASSLVLALATPIEKAFAGGVEPLTLTPSSGPPNTMVRATGGGAVPGDYVYASGFGVKDLASVTADASGNFSLSLTVPAAAAPGPQTIQFGQIMDGYAPTATFTVVLPAPAAAPPPPAPPAPRSVLGRWLTESLPAQQLPG